MSDTTEVRGLMFESATYILPKNPIKERECL